MIHELGLSSYIVIKIDLSEKIQLIYVSLHYIINFLIFKDYKRALLHYTELVTQDNTNYYCSYFFFLIAMISSTTIVVGFISDCKSISSIKNIKSLGVTNAFSTMPMNIL